MRTTRQLSITLPDDMADSVKAHVASGQYASESEVIRDGLRALFAQDAAIESWLRTEVAAAYDDLVENPGNTVSAEHIRARLARKHAEHAMLRHT